MDSVTNTAHHLASLLLASEREDIQDHVELINAMQTAFAKLKVHFSRRLGSDGYRALLTRALSLAAADFRWLSVVKIDKDGSMEGFAQAAGLQDLSTGVDGSIAVIAGFIGLLETFVGKELSMRLLGNMWPEAVESAQIALKEDSNG